MLTQIINGRIFTPQGWLNEGSVLMRDGKILEVTNCDLALIAHASSMQRHVYRARLRVYARAWRWRPRLHRMYRKKRFAASFNAQPRSWRTSFYPTIFLASVRKAAPGSPRCASSLWQSPTAPYWDCTSKVPISTKKMAGEQLLPTR